MTHATTIQIDVDTRKRLGGFKEYSRETYDEILNKLMKVFEMARSEGKFNKKFLKEIKEGDWSVQPAAREEILEPVLNGN